MLSFFLKNSVLTFYVKIKWNVKMLSYKKKYFTFSTICVELLLAGGLDLADAEVLPLTIAGAEATFKPSFFFFAAFCGESSALRFSPTSFAFIFFAFA